MLLHSKLVRCRSAAFARGRVWVCIPKSEKCGRLCEFRQILVSLVGDPGDP